MDYAVMRLKKIKSLSAFRGIEHHDQNRDQLRHREHPERSQDNYHLRPSGYYTSDSTLADRFKDRTKDIKIRKNAVLAYEIVLSFSPSALDRIPPEEWVFSSCSWLADTFGGLANVLDVSVHLDERTPHIHAVVIPSDEKGHLNAKHYTGTRRQLSDLQTSYAQAMEPFGLSRGVKYYETHEKRHHCDHRAYNAHQRQKQKTEKEQQLEKSLRSHQIQKEITDHTTHSPLSR